MNNDIVAAVTRFSVETPSAAALDCDGDVVTYFELERWASALAQRLTERGIGPGDAIAIRSNDHNEHVAAVLAAWRIGAWYVVVREAIPADRVAHLLGVTEIRAGIVTPGLTPLPGIENIALERIESEPGPVVDSSGLAAYACFTSGSTGVPKGVIVPHSAIRSFAAMIVDFLDLRAEPFFTGAEDDWDGSFIGTWSPMLVGGCSVSTRDRVNPDAMVAQILRTATTRAFFTTALGELLLHKGLPQPLRDVLVAGDELRTRPPRGATYRMWNIYGPTEGVVVCTGGLVGADDERITIGTSLPGSHVEVVDDDLRRVPDGVTGQLTIEGRLAWGYIGQPRLTAAAFIPSQGGTRKYLTGDAAQVMSDGSIAYLGRRDRQVSVRGRRIELDGVAVAAREVLGIERVHASVIDDHDGPRLVLFVEDTGTDSEAARKALAVRLPAAEMPDQIVIFDQPLSNETEHANAERHRAAIDGVPAEDDGYDEVDDVVLSLWTERMSGTRPALDANFFASGGTSLTAIHLIQELQEAFEVILGVTEFFREPTPRRLAAQLRAELLKQLDALSEDERQTLTAEMP